jgi:hypothetical protein
MDKSKTEEKPIDAVYCVGEIENLPANIIIDSGSVSNAISYEFLMTTGRTITKPSNILLSGINGATERPLGEIIDLEILIGGQTHNINALVMEKGQYDLLLGNIWAYEHNAKLDWKAGWLTCEIRGKELELPVTCTKIRQKPEINLRETSSDNLQEDEDEFEYEKEELIEQPLLWAQEDNGEVSMKLRIDQNNIQINDQLVDQITLDRIKVE